MSNVIIIGSGPAGISAALYTARAGIGTTVISKGSSALIKADKIENYYGFSDTVSGQSLEQNGIDGAKRLGVEFLNEEVLGISFEDKLTVKTTGGTYGADCILIATGTSRKTPKIKGLTELEGKGVSYCSTCDGFFYRGKDVAVIGNGEYAVHEATELLPITNSVTIVTDGLEPTVDIPEGVTLIKKKIKELTGNDQLSGVTFEDDTDIKVDGVFIALGVAGSTALAKNIGAVIDGNKIVVNENMATNIPGLYAAGDCTGGLMQVSKSVYEGAKAGSEIIKHIRAQKKA